MIFILPTDTLFGIFTNFDLEKFDLIFQLKKRPLEKRLALYTSKEFFLSNIKKIIINDYFYIKNVYFICNLLFPNNFTFLIKTNLNINCVTKNKYIGIRCIKQRTFDIFIKKYKVLFGTSANISGENNLYTLEELKNSFPNISIYYDTLQMSFIESTIIKIIPFYFNSVLLYIQRGKNYTFSILNQLRINFKILFISNRIIIIKAK